MYRRPWPQKVVIIRHKNHLGNTNCFWRLSLVTMDSILQQHTVCFDLVLKIIFLHL